MNLPAIRTQPEAPCSDLAIPVAQPLTEHQPEPLLPGVAVVTLKACPHHPALRLFASKADAQLLANELGPPWVPFAFTCGYMLTTGWHFRDADGLVQTFCPVPHQVLESLQELVRNLQSGDYSTRECPGIIEEHLRGIPILQQLPRSYYEAVCFCTLMRLGYPAPCDAPDDWLTIPAWALRMKRRRPQLPPAT